jgi:hypothetical protein
MEVAGKSATIGVHLRLLSSMLWKNYGALSQALERRVASQSPALSGSLSIFDCETDTRYELMS